jgi:hypothetical protein
MGSECQLAHICHIQGISDRGDREKEERERKKRRIVMGNERWELEKGGKK